ncbi:MAG TPA: hypothetical protein VLC92_00375 [Rhodocyclaceae bacterium]|nr:hypothetical protein [Rhodocyclaceae bacterium]
MQLSTIGEPTPDRVELSLNDGTKVLFSHGRPVAASIPGKGYIRTDAAIPADTEQHIQGWVSNPATVPQAQLDGLIQARA